MNLEITKLLDREMTRKEFLLYFFTFFLLVSGISFLLKNLNQHLNNHNSGFGLGPYGGREK
jgi:hypothetical protein